MEEEFIKWKIKQCLVLLEEIDDYIDDHNL